MRLLEEMLEEQRDAQNSKVTMLCVLRVCVSARAPADESTQRVVGGA